tara:strand:+ start:920 stop:1315 length:396 start_codon:yes stop_codon:yes gene_type:complete
MRKNITKFSKIESTSCDLIFFNRINSYIKKLERVFFLISKRSCVRGNHAHKKCSQFFFSLKSNVTLLTNDGKNEKKIILKYGEIIKIKPLIWVKVKLKKNQIVGVLCNKKYAKNDYIRDFNYFLKLIKKQK